MERTHDTGSTDTTSPVIIERIDSAQPSFFSRKLGRDFGQPNGAWTPDRAQATRMPGKEAADVLEGMLPHESMMCKAVRA